jgi:esterase/lipase superfamily enzyme
MKHRIITSVIVFAILTLVYSVSFSQVSRVEVKSFFSPKLGITKSYYVYLPAGYDSTTERYPVVYLFRAAENEWFTASYRSYNKMIKDVADSLYTNGLTGKMILIGASTFGNSLYAPGMNMLRPDLAVSDPGIGQGKFEDYIITDLIHNVDSTYRTIADFNHRAIDGFSLGAYTSSMLALKNPGLFSSVGGYDGTLIWYNIHDPGAPGTGYNDETWMTDNAAYFSPIFDLPRNVPYMITYDAANILYDANPAKLDSIKNLRFHITCGDEFTLTNRDRNTQFVGFLSQKHIHNSFRNFILTPGAVHLWDYADLHASKTLIRHWQKFKGVKISAPLSIDFSNVEIGTADTARFLVFNYGPASVLVNSAVCSPSVYTLNSSPSLPYTLPGRYDSMVVKVLFKPVATGPIMGTVSISSNDTASPVTTVNLSGIGFPVTRTTVDVLYGVSGQVDTVALVRLDTSSGTGTKIGKTGITNLRGLSIRPTTGKLFATYPNISSTYIVKINAADGSAFQYSEIPISNISSIAFDLNDELYAALDTNGLLYKLNPLNGDTTFIGATGISNLAGIAINPVNRQLFGVSLSGGVYKINKVNAAAVLVGNTGFANTRYAAFNLRGKMYGVYGSETQISNLISIDTSTGAGTLIGATGKRGIYGIAIQTNPISGVVSTNTIPERFSLLQNYPNPFNPLTVIRYQLSVEGLVSIKVYDVTGREMQTLVNEAMKPGTYDITFDGSSLSSGVYYYRMTTKEFMETRRMVLLK